jgi:hypothetical protein
MGTQRTHWSSLRVRYTLPKHDFSRNSWRTIIATGYEFNGSSTKVLLPVVDKIREDVLDGLAGLYVDSLLARPFVRPGGRV